MSAAAADSQGEDDVRILRRVSIAEGPTGLGDPDAGDVVVVVDCETTGRDPERDRIVELAVRRFRHDGDGRVVRIGRGYCWLEDPDAPLDPVVSRLTGLTDEDLAGRKMDDAMIERLFAGASLVVAHNSAFDRKYIERRFPALAGMAWGCSMQDVPWLELGFDGRSLGYLLTQCGLFHVGHRALVDVDAVVALLMHRTAGARPLLADLVGGAMSASWDMRAMGASISRKEVLRARGYRWDARDRVWHREVRDRDRMMEEAWLSTEIYRFPGGATCMQPAIRELDRFSRYA